MPKFVADENIPSPVVKRLREAGYDVKTVPEVASAGIRNSELAELSIKVGRIVLSRDADFTRLKHSLMERVKVIYIQLNGEPEQVAEVVLQQLGKCVGLLRRQNVVVLDGEGCR
jgi:predicted nuclease of predicted toxin-antitoxin system